MTHISQSVVLRHVLKGSSDLGLISERGRGIVSKEVGEEERGARGGVDRRSDNATSVDVEIDPRHRRLGRSQTDFALQAIVECRAASEMIAVLLRSLVFGGLAFPPVSLGPAGDCPCKLSEGSICMFITIMMGPMKKL